MAQQPTTPVKSKAIAGLASTQKDTPTMNLMTYPLFIMPGLGMGELVILFLIILIIFGPGKLPDVMRSLGEGVRQFKNATKELTSDHKPAEPKPTEVTPENKSV